MRSIYLNSKLSLANDCNALITAWSLIALSFINTEPLNIGFKSDIIKKEIRLVQVHQLDCNQCHNVNIIQHHLALDCYQQLL